jgi:hypothetical protein
MRLVTALGGWYCANDGRLRNMALREGSSILGLLMWFQCVGKDARPVKLQECLLGLDLVEHFVFVHCGGVGHDVRIYGQACHGDDFDDL